MKEYQNLTTGETTTDHRTAVNWYRNGHEIAIIVKNQVKLTWEH